MRNGETYYPYVADVDAAGLLVYHRPSRQSLPVPWRDLIQAGAELYHQTPEEFLDFLRRVVAGEPANTTLSGPSAPTTETGDVSVCGRSRAA